MTAISSPMLAAGSLAASHGSDREKLAGAARQFEAIFVRQMLAAARKTSFGEPLLGGQGLDTFRTMQDEHFADLAAQTGAFGFGKLIEAQLSMQISPLPPAGGGGGRPTSPETGGPVGQPTATNPPLTPPASGRGIKVSEPSVRGVSS